MLKSLISSFSYFVWSTKGKLFFGDVQGGQPQIAFKSSSSLSQFLCQIATSIITVMFKRCSLVSRRLDTWDDTTLSGLDNSSSKCAPCQHILQSAWTPSDFVLSQSKIIIPMDFSSVDAFRKSNHTARIPELSIGDTKTRLWLHGWPKKCPSHSILASDLFSLSFKFLHLQDN